jgi:hypothetical protein
MLRIAVGTKNPCKVDAVTKALKQCIRNETDYETKVDIHIEGFTVESGVPDQPFGDVSQWSSCSVILYVVVVMFHRTAYSHSCITSPTNISHAARNSSGRQK